MLTDTQPDNFPDIQNKNKNKNKNKKTRIDRVVTKTGDQGESTLSDGKKISKSSPIFNILGDVDELNSLLGLVISFLPKSSDTSLDLSQHPDKTLNQKLPLFFLRIQQELFNFGAELAYPEKIQITSEHIIFLEAEIADFQTFLTPLKEFILPGGSQAASFCHLARTVCRRAERALVQYYQYEKNKKNKKNKNAEIIINTHANLLVYLNRLSDWLFIMARSINLLEKHADIFWKN